MPKSCRAPRCPNAAGRARAGGTRPSFYRFPLQDAARLRQWLRQMRREHWVPTRHQHLCSDHFEPSCFQYRWGVRYLRPDAVPTIFPGSPPKQESPDTPPGPAEPAQPLPASGTVPVSPGRPLSPDPAAPPPLSPAEPGGVPAPVRLEPVPAETAQPPAPPPPGASPAAGEPSTAALAGLVLALQRKVKVLQQRHRRHRARLEAMEGLVEQLRRESLLSEERLRLACLQAEPARRDPASAVTIICREEEEEEEGEGLACAVPPLACAVPPPAGTASGLSLEQP